MAISLKWPRGTYNSLFVVLWMSLPVSFLSADEKPPAQAEGEPNGVEFRLAVDTSQEGYEEATLPREKQKIYLAPEVILSKKDIRSVAVEQKKVNELLTYQVIKVNLNESAGKRFKSFTSANINKRVAVVVHGKVIFAPLIRVAISDSMEITGKFSDEEVKEIVKAMTK